MKRLIADPACAGSSLAWLHNNIALMLTTDDPECERHARSASDIFLAAGNRTMGVKCLFRVADCRLSTSPQTATDVLDELTGLLEGDGPGPRDVRGAVALRRAKLALQIGDHASAFRHANESAETLRALVGAEADLSAALAVAVVSGMALGRDVTSLSHEVEALPNREDDCTKALRNRLWRLQESYSPDVVEALRDDIRGSEDPSLEVVLNVLIATSDTRLSVGKKLELLEVAQALAHSFEDKTMVFLAIGAELMKAGEKARALAVYRELLNLDRVNRVARQNIAALLFDLGRFREAVRFFEDQLQQWGKHPGLKFALGKALFLAGEPTRAVNLLSVLAASDGIDAGLRTAAGEWRDKAVNAGGMLTPVESIPVSSVSRIDLQNALAEFREYVKRDKRMSFWQGKGTRRKWVSSPEAHAKHLLQTFLKGKFGEHVEVLEELGSGAGRMDLYLRFQGGLSVVMELKMLGSPGYSSTYAFEGASQITHYMDNRKCHLGYLVIFDARARDWGVSPDARISVGSNTIHTVFVDVRPQVKT